MSLISRITTCMILAWADQSWNARSTDAIECAYGRLCSMAYRTWQIERRWLALRHLTRATSPPRGNNRDFVSYKPLVRWCFACALRGGTRGFRFIDPLKLRPRGPLSPCLSRTPRKPRATIVQLYIVYGEIFTGLTCSMTLFLRSSHCCLPSSVSEVKTSVAEQSGVPSLKTSS